MDLMWYNGLSERERNKARKVNPVYYINVTDKNGISIQTFHETNQIIAWRIYHHLCSAEDMFDYYVTIEGDI